MMTWTMFSPRRACVATLPLALVLLACNVTTDVGETAMGETATDGDTSGGSSGDTATTTTAGTASSGGTGTASSGTAGSSSGGQGTGGADTSGCDTTTPSAVIYVNLDGAVLTSGSVDNAPENVIGGWEGTIPPYGDGPKREQLMEEVRKMWAPFNILIVFEPPPGAYSMVVVGPAPGVEPTNGFGKKECIDANAKNITVVSFTDDDGVPAIVQARLISQLHAMSMGLDWVTAPDIMHFPRIPNEPPAEYEFHDNCLEVDAESPSPCNSLHKVHCPEGFQSSYADLLASYGACPE